MGLGDFRFFDATDHDSPLVAGYRNRGEVATFPPCFRCGRRVCDCRNNVLLDPQVATFIARSSGCGRKSSATTSA